MLDNAKLEDIEKLQSKEIVLLLDNIYQDRDGLLLFVYKAYKPESYNSIGRFTIRFGESDDINYLGNIGYNIKKRYRGKGYALKACNLILDLLKQYKIDKVIITTDVDNTPSNKICEKLGGVLTETLDKGQGLRKTQKNKYIINTNL